MKLKPLWKRVEINVCLIFELRLRNQVVTIANLKSWKLPTMEGRGFEPSAYGGWESTTEISKDWLEGELPVCKKLR